MTLLRGVFYYQINAHEKAKTLFTQAVAADPSSAEAQEYLGSVLRDEGQMPAAVEAFRKAADLAPQNILYLVTLANAVLKTDQDKQALLCFDKALAARPEDFDTWVKKTVLLMKIGTVEERTRTTRNMLVRYPRFMGGYEWLGDILEKGSHAEEALAIYKTMAEMFPNEAAPYVNLARASDHLGRLLDMKTYMAKAVRIDPSLAKNPIVQKILRS